MTLDTGACNVHANRLYLSPKAIRWNLKTHFLLVSFPHQHLQRFKTMQRECQFIVWSLLPLRSHLEGQGFTNQTDHDAHKLIFSVAVSTRTRSRWRLSFKRFDTDVIYRPGIMHKAHKADDELSRLSAIGKDESSFENELLLQAIIHIVNANTSDEPAPGTDHVSANNNNTKVNTAKLTIAPDSCRNYPRTKSTIRCLL